jgi:hypothetical protein
MSAGRARQQKRSACPGPHIRQGRGAFCDHRRSPRHRFAIGFGYAYSRRTTMIMNWPSFSKDVPDQDHLVKWQWKPFLTILPSFPMLAERFAKLFAEAGKQRYLLY